MYCGCGGKPWRAQATVEGTPEEAEFLKTNGFQFTEDCLGNKYYMGSFGRLIWLLADGGWSANPRPGKDMSFEKYVKASTWLELLAI
jgi:hypothetical protein